MPPKSASKKPATKAKAGPRGMAKPIPPGLLMKDLAKKEWVLGPVIGQGGFGYIYLGGVAGSSAVTAENAVYVIKVEPHENGPLFVELAFYIRVAKPDMINTWMKTKKLSHLGVPLFIGSGSFEHEGIKYRFMVINRFGTDVEKICAQNGGTFPEKTVYSLGLRIIDALEYLHEHDYVHADIKASNLMMGHKKGETSKMYLLDYGLAYKYRPGGNHVAYKEDPKRKHDGTIEYTSRDAHKGLAPSRRGDLEILGYCMIQWLCKTLPWEDKLLNKDYVFQQKDKYMKNLKEFMSKCFTSENRPDILQEYMEMVNDIDYDGKPDYDGIRKLFKIGLKKCGATDDGKSVILPTAAVKTPRKTQSKPAVTPLKGRAALKDLPPENSPKKTRTPVKRAPSPVKKKGTRLKGESAKESPLKVPSVDISECSPVKRVQASQGVRRSPRRQVVISSDESDDDKPLVAKKAKPNSQDMRVGNGSLDIEHGTSSVVLIDGVERTVHRRPRKRNVSTRDFGQSP